MRILHVYKDVYPPVVGGIERHIDAIRRALPDLQHDVLVCGHQLRTRVGSGPNGGREIFVGEFGRVLSTPIAPTFPYWLARYARGAIVHVHMPQPVGELSALIARRGSPLVVSYHADIYRQRSLLFLYRPLVLKVLRAADAVVTGSERLRETSPLLRDAGVDAHVVGYGIDPARFSNASQAHASEIEQIRDRYGSHLLAVGRLVPYKGFAHLIAAARDLPCEVVIVGDGVSRQDLADQIASLDLGEKVHLAGRVDDARLAAHLAAADVLVLPSWNRAEAFGIALLEAQAAGTPVIATDVGTGTADAMIPGKTGLLIPPNDESALVSAVTELIADPARREEMGREARSFVQERYSLQAMGAALRAIYEDVSSR